jgi:hypothetical protein
MLHTRNPSYGIFSFPQSDQGHVHLMESESTNHPTDFLILDSSPQLGDGLDYDRKAAQAAMEGKPFVLLFGCASDKNGRVGLLPRFKSREAIVCYVDIVNCRNKSLRSYMQLIGLEAGGDPSESLNGTAQIFTVTRNESGGLILHSTGSPTFNVRENCDALNQQLQVIRALLSPQEQNEHLEVTPLPSSSDLPSVSVAAMPPPEVSFAPPSPEISLVPAPSSTVDSIQSALDQVALELEQDDPSSVVFRRKIEEFAKQWIENHQTALNSSNPNFVADPTVTTE